MVESFMTMCFKRSVLLGAFVLGAFVSVRADSVTEKAAALFGDPVVARGKGFEIKRGQLDDAFVSLRANMAAQGRGVSEAERPLHEARLLNNIIIARLLVCRAIEADKVGAITNADRYISEARRAYASEDVFGGYLKAMGVTFEQYRARVIEQTTTDIVLEREIKSKITISDAQVEEYYKTGTDLLVEAMEAELRRMSNNPKTTLGELDGLKRDVETVRKSNLARLEEPERVRASHVLVSTRPPEGEQRLSEAQLKARRLDIDRIAARVKGGEDFAKLAREVSQDPRARETGGEYTFTKDDPGLPIEFIAAAFSLTTNQVSDVVVTRVGYHLIKLHERIPGKKLPHDQVVKEIRDVLTMQEMEKRIPDYFEKLKQEAAVEILDARYKLPKRSGEPRRSSF
jgi:parvulin-like peptidyl-prolyl isomerase